MRAAGKQSHHWCNVEYRCYVNTMPIRSIRLTIWFTFLLIFLCRYWSRLLLCAHRSMEWLAFPPRKHFNGMSAWARSRNLCACNNIVSRIDDDTDHLINSFSHRPEFFATTFLHYHWLNLATVDMYSIRHCWRCLVYGCFFKLECCLRRIQCLQIGWNEFQCWA